MMNNEIGTTHLNSKQIKNEGAHYTPKNLSDFVAKKMFQAWKKPERLNNVKILDPAVGDGNLLISLVKLLKSQGYNNISVTAYDTDKIALRNANKRFKTYFNDVQSDWIESDFINYIIQRNKFVVDNLFSSHKNSIQFDLIIANPPYVRTQNLGKNKVNELSRIFQLKGRVDIYYAFLVAMKEVLTDNGVVGIIVSNRFMTTRSGKSVREKMLEDYNITEIFDFGDTKIFEAAVLPAVLVYKIKKNNDKCITNFSTIYSTEHTHSNKKAFIDVTEAIDFEGIVSISNKCDYIVCKGILNAGSFKGDVWTLSTNEIENWLSVVKNNTFCVFKDIGKIRVGVKTTADKVFIRKDWDQFPKEELPELLHPLTTHHIAQRFRPLHSGSEYKILYPHGMKNGKRAAVDLNQYPKSKHYLELNKEILSKREYVIKSGRNWFEIWVPQHPDSWEKAKLVFRDISDKPIFWMDFDKTIVNGDCYWMIADEDGSDLLWLALAVGNSSFIIKFYDYMFQNKLYASRRRFITQYVERFPIPNPKLDITKSIISLSKEIYSIKNTTNTDKMEKQLDKMVWESFGLR